MMTQQYLCFDNVMSEFCKHLVPSQKNTQSILYFLRVNTKQFFF